MPSKKTRGWGWRWGLGLGGVGFEPTDIAGCVLWLDADAITGLSDGDPVATWSDLSGNSNDATQTTTAQKPTYKTSIQNGRAIVRFDGSDDNMILPALVAENFDAMFVFVVLESDDQTTEFRFFVYNEEGVFILFRHNAGDTSEIELRVKDTVAARTVTTTAQATDSWHYISAALLENDDSQLWTNGTDRGSVSVGDFLENPSPNRRLGVGRTGASNPLAGDIAEVVIYNTDLSTTDRQSVESYLAARWDI